MTDAGEIVFRPKYGFRHYVALVAGPILAALGLFLAITMGKKDPKAYLAAAFFVSCTVAIFTLTVRRIRFGSEIYVDRYLLPPRRFRYSDVKDVGVRSITTKRGHISLLQVENVDELHEIFEQVVKQGRMSEGQIEGELAGKEILASAAAIYALVASLVISLVLAFVRLPWPWLSGPWVFLAVFLVVYPVCYLFVRRRAS